MDSGEITARPPSPQTTPFRILIADGGPVFHTPFARVRMGGLKWAKFRNRYPILSFEETVPRNGDEWPAVSRNNGDVVVIPPSIQTTFFMGHNRGWGPPISDTIYAPPPGRL